MKGLLSPPPQNELKRNNFDVIHLTFIIKETEEYNNKTGKVFITMPAVLLNPEVVVSQQDKFSEEDFPNTETMAQVFVGKTKFSLFDIKNLENDDVVVFEDSNIENLQLAVNGKAFQVKLNPNMDILIPAEEDGGEEMSSNTPNIWDSLEVEMTAEFDAVKISLGELKSIENGLVVDLTSLYENNVTLKVEGNPIASGNLVIVNDRYGVKINQILTGDKKSAPAAPVESAPPPEGEEQYNNPQNSEEYDENEEEENNSEDEEFDYSDFELEDENI